MASSPKLWFSSLRNDAPLLLGSSLWKWMWSPRNRGAVSCSSRAILESERPGKSGNFKIKRVGKTDLSRMWITRANVWTRSKVMFGYLSQKETTAVFCWCQVCPGTQCDCDLHHPFRATSAGSIGTSAAIWCQVGRSLALGFRILGDLRLLFLPPGARGFHKNCLSVFWLVGISSCPQLFIGVSNMLLHAFAYHDFLPLHRLIRPMLSLA